MWRKDFLLHGTYLCRFLLMFSTGFTSLIAVLLFPLLITLFVFKHWSPFSSNIDEVLSINPSAYVFVFGDFNIYHEDWLTYSGGTDRSGQLCYNFPISSNLTQMINFPTQIPDCDLHSPALLDVFISSDTSICSTIAFPPFRNSVHVVFWVSIGFPLYLQWDAPFHHIAYDYSCADWDDIDNIGWYCYLCLWYYSLF